MTHYYSSAQLAFFRSALALLANSVEQGSQVIAESIDQKLPSPISGEIDTTALPKMDAYATQSIASSIEPSEPKVKHIFSGLTWFSKKKETSSDSSSKPVAVVEDQVVVKHSASIVEITSREHPKEVCFSTTDTRITSRFFSELPWAAKSTHHNIESLVDNLSVIVEPLSTPGINPKFGDGSLCAGSFFKALPWAELPVKSSTALNIENIAASKEVADFTQSAVVDSATTVIESQTAKSFFSDMPWLQANDILVNGQHAKPDSNQDIPDHQVAPETTQFFELKPVGRYFQSLPWHDKSIVVAASVQDITQASNDDISSIFAAATQSALLAAQKSQLPNNPQGNNKIDTFFSSLPWDGNR